MTSKDAISTKNLAELKSVELMMARRRQINYGQLPAQCWTSVIQPSAGRIRGCLADHMDGTLGSPRMSYETMRFASADAAGHLGV
jgi:hypothetical protein